ncbi:hypothetical protein RN001_009409 [Aquatica leii]|uniref:Tyr recombinase domain-containing protein n=1 Tax=Aquatica leii TaxID=1421715 RepID=A0AAN7QG90_9COLE|nr:hypothetical protein RN001_009409 [Aquatica leii]
MLVEGGVDLLALKQHGGWRSSAVAERYVEESTRRKVERSQQLFNQTVNISNIPSTVPSDKSKSESSTTTINISNNSNCTINVTFN